MDQLSKIVTSGNQTRVDFTAIASGYSALKVIWTASDVQVGSALTVLRMRLNDDITASNYSPAARVGTQNGVNISTAYTSTANGFGVGALPQSGNGNAVAQGELTLAGYDRAKHKNVAGYYQTDVTAVLVQTGGAWKSDIAIDHVTFSTDGIGFVDGSVFTLYGL